MEKARIKLLKVELDERQTISRFDFVFHAEDGNAEAQFFVSIPTKGDLASAETSARQRIFALAASIKAATKDD